MNNQQLIPIKKRSIVFVILFYILIIVGFLYIGLLLERENNRQMERNERREEMIRQAEYSVFMGFYNRNGWPPASVLSSVRMYNREVIFVRSMEEALEMEHSWNPIALWPSPFTLGALETLNKIVFDLELLERNDATVETLGLTFPITIDDIVFNWQSIQRLIDVRFTPSNRTFIRRHAALFNEHIDDDLAFIRLTFAGLDTINKLALEMERYPSRIELEWINQKNGTDFTIQNLPMPPFTEEEVRNNPLLIEDIVITLLTWNVWSDIRFENVLRRQHEQNN